VNDEYYFIKVIIQYIII